VSLSVPPAGEIILTYDDYLQLPDDGKRYEILEGVLHVTPSLTTRHQRVSRNLHFILHAHVTENNLGEVFFAPLDVVFSNISVTQPDLLYVSRERQNVITEKNIAGAPDLVVEILSPSTSGVDQVTKAQVYARYGVPYYWVVDPEGKTVDEFRLERGIYMPVRRWEQNAHFTPELFPGLVVELEKVWA
jgi:Uma2 family endonuclease